MTRLKREETLLAVIDVQERLAPAIHEVDAVVANLERLIRGTYLLNVPAVVTEQYVKGLGPTVPELRRALEESHAYRPIEKLCFSSAGCADFMETVRLHERKRVVLAGVETHVCVYQTAIDLIARGYEVQVVADAVSSRTPRNRDIALQRLAAEGAKLTSTEMCLFELTETSGTDEFRAISKLVK